VTTTVAFGATVLGAGAATIVPRPWTMAQSAWAGELAAALPPGPIVELCAGCGGIGLDAAARTGRDVILVDASADACRWARRNATTNGLADRVEVRHAPLDRALGAGERFPLILADPPYVPTAEVGRYSEDPVPAIDGGPDGLAVHRLVLAVIGRHLAPGGVALVQTRGAAQAGTVGGLAASPGLALRPGAVRAFGTDRAVIELRRPERRASY
jgi:methylase of polypeptide subunit release factors